MEQLISFWSIIILLGISIETNSPILFGITFIGGLTYMIIRGKIKGWSLPREIKKRHSW